MNILILDDHPLFAEALRQILLRLGNHVFVHVTDHAHRAIGLIDGGKTFDLILLDLKLPGLDGFAFMRLLRDRFVTAPVVIVSASRDADKSQQALEQGAMGYIHKSSDAKTILSGIHQVLAGNMYCLPLQPAAQPINFPNVGNLSPTEIGISERQFDTLLLMDQGFSNKEIAREMGITESTVKTHVSRLISALAVHNRTACVLEAKRLGLL
ncbi:response regulator [Thiothrix nivea]|uniref:Two component transcriptional regulator, LuxR family n=1 Tax=Thiothrix nivea (strain ATCC 35100 / DSM 5205 / JP2) TaxID=870187 RepID=A0A656HCJ2_THINJ|nr:response regulator transcription factor [Thiothrix nivea]EIJ34073.1 two component transcriptional regulator, LuxR family [Thiothrix nivea DSM 5205]